VSLCVEHDTHSVSDLHILAQGALRRRVLLQDVFTLNNPCKLETCQTLQWVQAIIARQLQQKSDQAKG
jgi:hypothetical protein